MTKRARRPHGRHHIAFIPTGEIGNVQSLIALAQQKRLEALAAEVALKDHLARVTGVDLTRENWELDAAHWVLLQHTDSAGQAVNPMDVVQ